MFAELSSMTILAYMRYIPRSKQIFFAAIFFIQLQVQAQQPEAQPVSLRANTLYGEIGGNGLFFSANYDFRFAKKQSGLGARAGLGFFASFIASGITIPVGLNYLSGKGPHYLESGLGATIVHFTGEGFFDEVVDSETGVVAVPSVGYRYQPLDRGFTARIFISPLIASSVQFWAGISAGIKF